MFQHIEQFQKYLKDNNASCAFLRMPENLVYFTQYWPRYGFSFLFIPAIGEPWIIIPEVEESDAKHVGVKNVITFGDVFLEDGDPIETLLKKIKGLREKYNIPSGSKVAIEGGENVMAPTFVANKVQLCGEATRNLIRDGFETDDFIMCQETIRIQRRIKSPSDIEKIQKVNRLLQNALDYFEEELNKPGAVEIDLLMDTQGYFSKLAAREEGTLASRAFGQLTTGPENSYVAWADGVFSTAREVQSGDVAMYEVGAVCDGYWCDLTRTGRVGGWSGKAKEIYDVVEMSFYAALDAAKDGATGHDVDKAARDVIKAAGYGEYFPHPTGHGTGFAHSEGYPYLGPGSTDILRENMCIAIEPAIYFPGIGGIRVEENCLVQKDGSVIMGK